MSPNSPPFYRKNCNLHKKHHPRMTNGSPGSVVDGVETGGRDLIPLGVMDPDGSDKSDDLPPDPKSLP